MICDHRWPELDNPFWTSLTTRQAHMGRGAALARRFLPAYSPIAAVSGAGQEHAAALQELVDVGDTVGVTGPHIPSLPANWQITYESQLTQMIRVDGSMLSTGEVEVVSLGSADVADMLGLVASTKPGPFASRTIEFGAYVGVRDGARLLAMAGERIWAGHCREVSAVCTHPHSTGRGYARALLARVVNRMLRAGQTPFLHVESHNLRAIELYGSLGFTRRTTYPLLQARRLA